RPGQLAQEPLSQSDLSPEYEDLAALARQTGRSLPVLTREAIDGFFIRDESDPRGWFRILQAEIQEKSRTPFFDALRRYSRKPTGMFHALPISRGRTIAKSHWIDDMGRFYGSNIFLAETSATTGGLDSLLQPTGSLRQAQARH
ncbi:MAG: ornithine decarboxylase, partial [Akkermansiaceae bacterium]|nr:ornithine decarboxylase [Akkermansiaceae bacterium]